MKLVSEKMQKSALQKYKGQNRQHHIDEAATRLWGAGVAWEEAASIVADAFDQCIQDDADA